MLSLGLMRFGGRLVAAQEATGFAGLGLPQLTVSVTDEGYAVSPATTTAGWTLVTFENQRNEGDTSADIMLLPQGETIEGLLGSLAASFATPTAGPPTWIFESTFAGASRAVAGSTARAVVDLPAGEWAVFSPEPLAPATLTVTAADNPSLAPPALAADVQVIMQEFAFLGLDAPVPVGQQIWKVTNAGRQPHFITFGRLPEGTTQAQFMDSLMTMSGGPADGDNLANVPTVGGCSTLSADRSLYLALDLAAGTYGAICFFPDEQSGAPHAAMGMARVFSVR